MKRHSILVNLFFCSKCDHSIFERASSLPESVRSEVKPINGTNTACGTYDSTDISCNLTINADATKTTSDRSLIYSSLLTWFSFLLVQSI